MASIHRRPTSKHWHAAFYLPDGRRTLRSTGTADRRKAMEIAAEYEKAARMGREARLTESKAREVIADIFAVANRETLPCATVKDYLQNWMSRKKLEVAESSFAEYAHCVDDLLAFLGAKAARAMDAITLADLSAYRDTLARRVSGGTVNKTLKILRGAWARAVKDGLMTDNALARLDLVKSDKSDRRAFTMDELKRILEECGQTEWRGLVLFGLYTGQRLSDVASLKWQNIDLTTNELRFVARKTKRNINLPLAKPLVEYLLSLPSADQHGAPVFPESCKLAVNRVSALSNQFSAILARIGLVESRTHESTGKGRNSKRNLGMSFHCLRHTATSLLKNSGVSDFLARSIIGHESESVSRIYSHVETGALRDAVNKLPDLTK